MNSCKSRELRKNMTDTERALWKSLRMRQMDGNKFRRQHPIGNFIVDFVCLEKKLIVEVDGGQHVELENRDKKRGAWLESQGFRILRFWNHEVLKDRKSVLDSIFHALDFPPPSSSPARGEEFPCMGKE